MKTRPFSLLTVLLMFILSLGSHQGITQPVISQSVFAVAGFSGVSDQMALSSTLGENFIYGGMTQDAFGCQGFQSGVGLISTSLVDFGLLTLNVNYFPNPTTSGITLQWDQPGAYTFEIYNTLGQFVARQTALNEVNEIYFDLRAHAPGLYSIFVKDHNQRSAFAGLVLYQPY